MPRQPSNDHDIVPSRTLAGTLSASAAYSTVDSAAATRGGNVKDAERDRQALAPFGHRNQVSVGRMVIAHQVAGELQVARQGLGQGFVRPVELEPLGEPARRIYHQGAAGGRIAARVFVKRAGERGLEEIESVVLRLARTGQGDLGIVARHAV